jgi:hypothetical protein
MLMSTLKNMDNKNLRKICVVENGNLYDCVHVSITKTGAFIRSWPERELKWEPERQVSPDEARAFERSAALSLDPGQACRLVQEDDNNGRGLRVEDARWQTVFRELRDKLNRPDGLTKVLEDLSIDAGAPVIPITTLRLIYTPTLREVIHAKGFHHLLCSEPKEMAELLEWYFRKACKDFGVYSNINEPFRPGNQNARQQRTLSYLHRKEKFANCLKARLIACVGPWFVSDHDELTFSFVDFEISPYRTTRRAVFSNGPAHNCSGGGGLDLLLCSDDQGLPVIGEIKAETDVDMFVALVQALTYASEMCTANQLLRLTNPNNFYGDYFQDLDQSQCDIYLFYQQTEGAEPYLLAETISIAQNLLDRLIKRTWEDGNRIRRIAFLKTSLPGGDEPAVPNEPNVPIMPFITFDLKAICQ